jgi:RNA polymerase sigma-70 factor, ECF subfamily
MHGMTDSDYDSLILRLRAGDRAAAEELVARLWPDVVSFIAVHAPWAELAEEITQAAFVTALERIAEYETRGTFSAWVKGIARNHLRHELARRSRMISTDREAIDACIAEIAIVDLERQEAVTEERGGMIERLRQCFESLPPRARLLAERRFIHDLPLNRLAQQFKRTRASIAKTIFVLRGQLRACAERGSA